jgi:hypothetical protein
LSGQRSEIRKTLVGVRGLSKVDSEQ